MARCRDFRNNQGNQSLIKEIEIIDGSVRHEMLWYYKYNDVREVYNLNIIYDSYVAKVHQNFLNAGANIIRTNTTEAFFSHMIEKYEYTEEMYKEMIGSAVQIADNVVFDHNIRSNLRNMAEVVGSCGQFKAFRVMLRSEIKGEYRRLIGALSDAGVKTFCLQDIQSLEDANIIVEVLNELQIVGTRTFLMFKPTETGFLYDGVNWIDAAIRCSNKIPVIAVGINCVYHRNEFKLLQEFKKEQNPLKNIPLMVCTSNYLLGEWRPVHLPRTSQTPPAIQWADLGIRYIGGCCGVDAKDIMYIRDELNNINDIPQ